MEISTTRVRSPSWVGGDEVHLVHHMTARRRSPLSSALGLDRLPDPVQLGDANRAGLCVSGPSLP
jgi:hypothetical protein